MSTICLSLHDLQPTHIRLERIGDDDGAVGLLVIFHDSHQTAAHGKAGTVQGMHVLLLFGIGRLELDIGAAGLKVPAVGA